MIALCAAALAVAWPGASGPARATLLPAPEGADLLAVQPRAGVTLETLRTALERRGVATLPASPYDASLRAVVPEGMVPDAIAKQIALTGLARTVEHDQLVFGAQFVEEAEPDDPTEEEPARLVPDDPLYEDRQARYLELVRAPEAWAIAAETDHHRAVVIAVVDSGVDWNHPDLVSQIFINFAEGEMNGRDDSGSGCPDDIAGCSFVSADTADPSCNYFLPAPNWRAMDDEGHGTFVAGLAAAAGDNRTGIAGIAWEAQILSVKVLDCTSTGRISEAAAGIRYAARMGADVINVSFGSRTDSLILREAVEEAQAAGALIVASAGNDGREGITFPAAYPGVVSVAASGLVSAEGIDYGRTAEFAEFGRGIDLIAPGVQVVSTVPRHLCGRHGWICHEEGPYATATGSSFATALVTGAAAVVRAHYPDASADLAGHILVHSSQPVPNRTGLLDVAAALDRTLFSTGIPGTSRAPAGEVDLDHPRPEGPGAE